MKKILGAVLTVVVILSLVCCGNNADVWADATYKEDTVFGNGSKTVVVEVVVLENSVDFTIKTDCTVLGDALKEHNLVEGEESEFGLYIKKVNGILADYDKNGAYWAFSKDAEMMLNGVDTTEISDGEHYELTYTK